jgi:hypothetical protein
MGTWVQAIIDRETATLEEARELGAAMVAWLADRRIIEDRPCDGPSGDELHYPAGSAFTLVCEGTDAAADTGHYVPSQGMRLVTKPDFLYCPQARFDPVPCPRCGAGLDNKTWMDAGFAWMLEGGADTIECPHCRTASPLRAWEDPESGFVMLGFEFHDWPMFSPAFLDAFSRRLGHRITHVYGKR